LLLAAYDVLNRVTSETNELSDARPFVYNLAGPPQPGNPAVRADTLGLNSGKFGDLDLVACVAVR
jgi:hypothetical protein